MKTERSEIFFHILIIALIIVSLWPVVFMLSASFKDLSQVFSSPLNPFPYPPTLDNYIDVLGRFNVFRFVGNTFFIAFSVTLFKLVTSILAGFAFVYYRFKGREWLFNSMLLTFFIPTTVLIMPNYLFMSKLGLLNTPYGVILPEIVDGMGIFLMRQAMRGIPKPLFETAALEGAGAMTVLRRLCLPLVRSPLIAAGIMFFINSWNEYFWPLLVLKDKSQYTLSLAMQMFISAEGGSEWGVAMAVAVVTSLPPLILYLFFQRFILDSFMQAGIKG